MKSIISLFLVVLLFASCSSDDDINQQESTSLLKSYTLIRNSNGSYSIDYNLADNAYIDVINDIASNTNELHLFSGDVSVRKSINKSLLQEDEHLNINFLEEGYLSSALSLEDKGFISDIGESSYLIESYSITNEGDYFRVDFKVKEGIAVTYVFNEVLNTYEIHLQEGVSKGVEYTKTYVKTQDVLKIDFINYQSYAAKSSNKTSRSRGPIIMLDNTD